MEHAVNDKGEAAVVVAELPARPIGCDVDGGRFRLFWNGGSCDSRVAKEFSEAVTLSGRVLVIEMLDRRIVHETWVEFMEGQG